MFPCPLVKSGLSNRSSFFSCNFSAALNKKCVQLDKASRYAGVEVDPEKSSGEKGTGEVNPAPELDACLLYEETVIKTRSCSHCPRLARVTAVRKDLMALSRPSTFGLDVLIEQSEEIPLHQADGTRVDHFGSKFLNMCVGTQKIEGRCDVRNVTKPIVAAGQVTDRGQGVWLNGDGGFILDVKSARKIEKLLGDKRGFIELPSVRNSHPAFSHWSSKSRVDGQR